MIEKGASGLYMSDLYFTRVDGWPSTFCVKSEVVLCHEIHRIMRLQSPAASWPFCGEMISIVGIQVYEYKEYIQNYAPRTLRKIMLNYIVSSFSKNIQ